MITLMLGMENKITVIVCTYNQEKTIGRTLDSILMQRCHVPVDILIGEDCSQDGTLSVCREYAERYPDRIRVIANAENKGVLDNYFDCIFQATGRYIADCAGDDYWIDPLKLEKELAVMEANDEVGIVHTDWQRYVETTREILPSPKACNEERLVSGTELLEDILTQTTRPVIHLCTSLYRTDWIRKAHDENVTFFRNREYPCEDVQTAFFLAKMGKVAYLTDVTLNYSQTESISQSATSDKLFRFYLRAGQLDYDLASTFNLLTPRVKAFLQYRIYELLMHAFRSESTAMRAESLALLNRWGIEKSTRISALELITANKITWKTLAAVRRIIIKCRKLRYKR